MKRNMITQRVGSILLIRQNKDDATDQDWRDFLEFLSANRAELDHIRILVYTDGGVPTASQRRRLAETLGNTHMLVAAVSDNMKVRFSGATIALFQRNYKQFTVAEMDRAFEHLRMTETERLQARNAFQKLDEVLKAQ